MLIKSRKRSSAEFMDATLLPFRMGAQTTPRRFYFFCGIVCVDDVFDVEGFPEEDSKVRATGRAVAPGGNAYNAAITFIVQEKEAETEDRRSASDAEAVQVCLCAAVGTDDESLRLQSQCESAGLRALFSAREGYATPHSVVLRTGKTRTIIHYRNLEELTASELEQAMTLYDFRPYDSIWFHMEGRNVEEMLRAVPASVFPRHDRLTLSLELERVRDGNEMKLLTLSPNIVVISKAFIEAKGFSDPKAFVVDTLVNKRLGPSRSLYAFWVVTQGERGSIGFVVDREHIKREYSCPAIHAEGPVDSLGAGDAFLGALIYALGEKRLDSEDALKFATEAAYEKISMASKRVKLDDA